MKKIILILLLALLFLMPVFSKSEAYYSYSPYSLRLAVSDGESTTSKYAFGMKLGYDYTFSNHIVLDTSFGWINHTMRDWRENEHSLEILWKAGYEFRYDIFSFTPKYGVGLDISMINSDNAASFMMDVEALFKVALTENLNLSLSEDFTLAFLSSKKSCQQWGFNTYAGLGYQF